MVYSFNISFVLAMLFGWIIEEGYMETEEEKQIEYISLHIYFLFIDLEITKVNKEDFDDLAF